MSSGSMRPRLAEHGEIGRSKTKRSSGRRGKSQEGGLMMDIYIYVCMYVCIYVYICVCVCVYVHCIYICIYVCV